MPDRLLDRKHMESFSQKRALVTGASSGFGAHFANLLAERNAHLVLVARRIERMAQLRVELQRTHPVQVLVEGMDLSRCVAGNRLIPEQTSRQKDMTAAALHHVAGKAVSEFVRGNQGLRSPVRRSAPSGAATSGRVDSRARPPENRSSPYADSMRFWNERALRLAQS